MSFGIITLVALGANPLATVSDEQLCESFRGHRSQFLAEAQPIDEHVTVTDFNVDCPAKRLVYQLDVPLIAPDSLDYAKEYQARMRVTLCASPTDAMKVISTLGWKYRWTMTFYDKTTTSVEVGCTA